MEAPDPPGQNEANPVTPDGPVGQPPGSEAPVGPDIATIGLLVFFIALIGIVVALLLLPVLTGCCT